MRVLIYHGEQYRCQAPRRPGPGTLRAIPSEGQVSCQARGETGDLSTLRTRASLTQFPCKLC